MQNAGVAVFTVSELLRENQQGEVKLPPPPPPPPATRLGLLLTIYFLMALLTFVQEVYWPKKLIKAQLLTQCNDNVIILL